MQVGFFNLIKRAKDQVNNLWVAEATENSTYTLTFDQMKSNHLKEAADSAQKWANISSLVCLYVRIFLSAMRTVFLDLKNCLFLLFLQTIENLKKRVLSVISNNEA